MTSMYFPLILILFSSFLFSLSQLKIIPNVLYKRELVFKKKVKSELKKIGDHEMPYKRKNIG